MTRTGRFESVVAEAPPTADSTPVTSGKTAAKLEMLEGDELIQLLVKPSLWFIPVVSSRVVVVTVLVAGALALAMRTGSTPGSAMPFQVLAGLAGLRIAIATLQWASRLYVLTNRRVMRFKGIFTAHVTSRHLVDISDVKLLTPWYARLLWVGSISMDASEENSKPLVWDDVSRPHELHETLVRAIRKAQSKGQ
jgi:hypothetical protein